MLFETEVVEFDEEKYEQNLKDNWDRLKDGETSADMKGGDNEVNRR